MTRAVRSTVAVAIVGLLVLHAIAWSPSQLLWACHVASVAIVIGLAFDQPRLVAAGVLFHVGEGIPAYVLDALAAGESSIVSVALHTIPVGSGLWALWGRPLPRGILIPAWLVHPVAMLGAYLFADPALNVMLVEKPWQATASLFPALWMSSLVNVALSLACITIGWLVLRLAWKRWE
jgi:hypothetical protein